CSVDVCTQETPAVYTFAQYRVDDRRTRTHVHNLYLRTRRYNTVVVLRKQVGRIMNIVRPAGNRRAKAISEDRPVLYIIVSEQYRFIELDDRCRIREIYGCRTECCFDNIIF